MNLKPNVFGMKEVARSVRCYIFEYHGQLFDPFCAIIIIRCSVVFLLRNIIHALPDWKIMSHFKTTPNDRANCFRDHVVNCDLIRFSI